jgi:hypothetical protein
MRTAEEIAALRLKLIEQLEAAQATADMLSDGVPGYLIERALDELRASAWPGNLDVPPAPAW